MLPPNALSPVTATSEPPLSANRRPSPPSGSAACRRSSARAAEVRRLPDAAAGDCRIEPLVARVIGVVGDPAGELGEALAEGTRVGRVVGEQPSLADRLPPTVRATDLCALRALQAGAQLRRCRILSHRVGAQAQSAGVVGPGKLIEGLGVNAQGALAVLESLYVSLAPRLLSASASALGCSLIRSMQDARVIPSPSSSLRSRKK